MKFVIASHNQKKIAEMDAILGALGIEFTAQPDDAPEPEETGTVFEENALIKARAACAFTGLPAVADDSGLCVDALDGAPGVYSARYCAGDDKDRNAFLLKNMEAVPDGKRQARFVSAIACVFPNGDELVVRGECEGEILRAAHGAGGFGYDPLFFVKEFDCTFGELPQEIKNQVSHRARALQKMKETLGDYYAEQ